MPDAPPFTPRLPPPRLPPPLLPPPQLVLPIAVMVLLRPSLLPSVDEPVSSHAVRLLLLLAGPVAGGAAGVVPYLVPYTRSTCSPASAPSEQEPHRPPPLLVRPPAT